MSVERVPSFAASLRKIGMPHVWSQRECVSRSLLQHHRQQHVRGSHRIVEHRVERDLPVVFFPKWPTCVQVTVVAGEIAARHVNTNPVTYGKAIRGRRQV